MAESDAADVAAELEAAAAAMAAGPSNPDISICHRLVTSRPLMARMPTANPPAGSRRSRPRSSRSVTGKSPKMTTPEIGYGLHKLAPVIATAWFLQAVMT